VFGLLLVAVSLGAANLAGAVGIGVSGVDNRTRLRVALLFGFFEAAMLLIGLAIGRRAASELGSATTSIGAGLLVAVGVYTIIIGVRAAESAPPVDLGPRLVLTSLALSIDNLVLGFALASFDVSFLAVVLVVTIVSVGMSLVGLELGNQLGTRAGQRSELIGGTVLVLVGIALAIGLLG